MATNTSQDLYGASGATPKKATTPVQKETQPVAQTTPSSSGGLASYREKVAKQQAKVTEQKAQGVDPYQQVKDRNAEIIQYNQDQDEIRKAQAQAETTQSMLEYASGKEVTNNPIANSLESMMKMQQDWLDQQSKDFEKFVAMMNGDQSIGDMYQKMVVGQTAADDAEIDAAYKEVQNLKRLLEGNMEDVKKRYAGGASDQYIRAKAAQQSEPLMRQLEAAQDRLSGAQLSRQAKREDAMAYFNIVAQEQQMKQQQNWQIRSTKYNMDQQAFNANQNLMMKDMDVKLQDYWRQKDMEDKIVLSKLSMEQQKEYAMWEMQNQRKENKIIETSDGNVVSVDPYSGESIVIYNGSSANPGIVQDVKGTGASGGQCGYYVNRLIPGMDQKSGKWFGDSLESKLKLVDSQTPIVGGAFIMDIGTKEGHVGVVTGINQDGTITVSDSNYYGDEKVSNRTLSKSEMKKIKGYMSPPAGGGTSSIIQGVQAFKFGLTKDEMATFDASISAAAQNEDPISFKMTLRNAYESRLTAQEQQRLRSRESLAYNTNLLSQSLDKYVAKGGDLGFFTGNYESILNKIGKTKDKDLAILQTNIADILDTLVRERTGAALTDAEMKFYNRMLPGIGKSLEYNKAIIQGLQSTLNNQNAYLDYKIGSMVTGKAKELFYAPESDPDRDESDFSSWLAKSSVSQFLPSVK